MGTRAIRRNPGARRTGSACARTAALATLLLAGPFTASAEEFLVTTTGNSGIGSLRQAILDLNELGAVAGEQHRIVFDDALLDDSIITLLTPLEDIDVNVEIDASSVSNLTLQGPKDQTFLRTSTGRVALIDLGTQNSLDPGTLFSAIEIGSRNQLVFDTTSASFVVTSDIRDATTRGGQLFKEGLGSLTLSGVNTYSGGTTVNAGTLLMTGTPPDAGRMIIGEGATLVLDPVAAFTLNNLLNGSGTFVKKTASDVTLLGGGAFTGLTQIVAGTLTDASGVIEGDVALDALTSSLVFDVADAHTHSGDISGLGDVTKANVGTLTLLGNNTYTGDLIFEDGTLIANSASLPDYIVASAEGDTTLIFDQSFTDTFVGDIELDVGTPYGLSLEKIGTGALTIGSVNIIEASNGTDIFEGTLIVDGYLITPTTTVAAGATLGGTGVIDNGDVFVEGILSPGPEGAQGILVINGDVDLQPSAIFEIDVDDSGEDFLDATGGTATLGGGILRVIPAKGIYSSTTSRTILSASSINGSLSFETDFFRLDVSCDAAPSGPGSCGSADDQTLQLTIVSNNAPWASAATTANQLTVGQILDIEEAAGLSPDFVALFQDLQVIPREQVVPLLDAIGGEPLTAFPTAQLAIGERFNRALHRRVRDAAWGKPDALFTAQGAAPSPARLLSRYLAGSPATALPAPETQRTGVRGRRRSAGPLGSFEGDTGVGAWLDGWGSFGTLEGDGSSADVETRSFGATLGLDYRFGERVTAGLAGGYAKADIDLDGRASQGKLDLAQGALYAGYVDPRFHVTASGRYARAWNDSERRIAYNAINLKTQADFASWDVGARAEVGADALRLGRVGVAPLAAFDWAQLRREEFAESGAGLFDLVVEDDTLTSLLSSLGGSLWVPFDLGDDVAMLLELRGSWLHEFGDVERAIRARLSGAVASGSFEILGAELPRDRVLAGLGWSASLGDTVRVFADYDVALGSGLLQHEVALTLRIHF